jgi:hypothetical protein
MNKTVQVTELLNHYTNNINWDLSDPDCWGVVESPEEHIYEIKKSRPRSESRFPWRPMTLRPS